MQSLSPSTFVGPVSYVELWPFKLFASAFTLLPSLSQKVRALAQFTWYSWGTFLFSFICCCFFPIRSTFWKSTFSSGVKLDHISSRRYPQILPHWNLFYLLALLLNFMSVVTFTRLSSFIDLTNWVEVLFNGVLFEEGDLILHIFKCPMISNTVFWHGLLNLVQSFSPDFSVVFVSFDHINIEVA